MSVYKDDDQLYEIKCHLYLNVLNQNASDNNEVWEHLS